MMGARNQKRIPGVLEARGAYLPRVRQVEFRDLSKHEARTFGGLWAREAKIEFRDFSKQEAHTFLDQAISKQEAYC